MKHSPRSPTEIAAALRASQRQEEGRYVTNHMNEYSAFAKSVCIMYPLEKEIFLV